MIEEDIVYHLTVRQKVINRYVKVLQTLRLFSLRFMHISVLFQL